MKKRKISAIVMVWALLFSMLSTLVAPITVQGEESGYEQVDPADIIPGEVIVRYKDGYGSEDLQKQSRMSVRSLQDVTAESEDGIALQTLRPGEDVEEVIAQLEQNPIVEYAEPNLKYEAFSTQMSQSSVNDPYVAQQWGVLDVKAEEGWQQLSDVLGSITVAVVDTGVDASHPDLAGRILPGKNFAIKMGSGDSYPENRDADDDQGHGTLVAGIISAVSNNGLGITGIAGASQVNILPVKVMNEKGYGSSYDIAAGIRYAADQQAAIINLSLGSDSYSRVIEEAISYAQSKGILVVAAAGNDGKNVNRYYPASLPGVVTVGALSSNGKVASFSNYGDALEIVAPGEGILSTAIAEMGDNLIGNETDGYYKLVDGTSFAAPHAAAVAALYRLKHPDDSPAAVTSALTSGATDVAPAGWDEKYGYGKLNLPATLQPNAEPQWTVLLQQPAANSLLVDTVTLKAEIVKQKESINKLRFYLDQVESAALIAEVAVTADSSVYQATWDTTKAADGSHTVIVVAVQDETEIGRYETSVTVRNDPQSGLLLKVLDPQNNPAVGATVALYEKVAVEADETNPLADASDYTYELVWSGQTSSAGAARIPSSMAHDLKPYTVVVQGQFDYPNAPDGSTVFLYQRSVQGPGEFTLDGTQTVPVVLTSTDKEGEALATASYFATALDAKGIVIGTTAPLNDENKTNAPTIYLDQGKYNLFAYSKTADATYFQSKWGTSITRAEQFVFDGTDTGVVTLSPDNEGVQDGVLYLYDEGSEQALGLNEEVLVGKELRVSAGSYHYWVDVEIADPNQSENWIYVFDSGANKAEVRPNQTTAIRVGGGLTLDYFEPDLDTLKAYLEKQDINYEPEENPYRIRKNYGIYYTKQQFSDHYANSLVGMYRGTLSGDGIWQKLSTRMEKPKVLRLDDANQAWETQEYYFGDLHANLKVTNKETGYVVYDSSTLSNLPGLRQFFWTAFWAVSRPDVTPGEYQLDLTLDENPLAGKALAASMTNIVHDDNIVSLRVTDGTEVYTPYVWIYHADQEASGEYTWEKSFGQWADRVKTSPNYKKVLINSEIPLSKEKNGNLAIIRFEYTGGKLAFLFKPFTKLSELEGDLLVDKSKLHLVTLQATDEHGDAIQAAKSTFGVQVQTTIDGNERVNFRHLLGADYKNGIWLEEGSYHFDGQFVTLPDSNDQVSNYYLLEQDVKIDAQQTTVSLGTANTAKVELDVKHGGKNNYRGAAIFAYSKFNDSALPSYSQGDIFYIPADIPMDLVLMLAYSDPDDETNIWNFMVAGKENQKLEAKEQETWKVSDTFQASLKLKNASVKPGGKLAAESSIQDEYGNRIFNTFIDQSTSWITNEDQEALDSYAYRRLPSGQIEPVEYEVEHEEGEVELPNEVYPYLQVFERDRSTPVLKVSKKSFYEQVEETLTGIPAGVYRAELAFAAGAGELIESEPTEYFIVRSSSVPTTPTEVAVTGVELDREKVTLTSKGTGVTLTAGIIPSNATNQAVSWSSSDPDVAVVDEHGRVTPVGIGEAIITVTTVDGNKTDTCVVTVKAKDEPDPDAKLVKVEATLPAIWLAPNESIELEVFAVYSDDARKEITTEKKTKYRIASSKRATVKAGVITAGKTEGTTTITIEYDKQKLQIPLTISKTALKELRGSKEELELVEGKREQLKATAVLSNGKKKDVTKTVAWTSADPKVATVKNGKVVAEGPGTTTITLACGEETAEVSVTVKAKEKTLKRLSVSDSSVKVAAGKQKELKLTAYFTDGSKKVITEDAKWASGQEEIATIDKGVITAIAPGKTVITATYQEKTVKIKLTVTE